jgi:hypothetical protein
VGVLESSGVWIFDLVDQGEDGIVGME